MAGKVMGGIIAGSAGTIALNTLTYLDMALRGRPPSSVPEKAVGELADRSGLDLGQQAENRRRGLGPLLGIATGLGVGGAYGMLRAAVPDVPVPVAAVGLGLAASAASNAPMTLLGVTDPSSWGLQGWLADLVPHLGYGLATAAGYEAITR